MHSYLCINTIQPVNCTWNPFSKSSFKVGAIIPVKLSDGFVGGYEFELLLIAISLSLLLTGPGRISIEWDVLKREIFPNGKTIIRNQKEALQKSVKL
jgi:uncharacterized membrane protein YphA (DoxX/SURF4 family)